MTDNNLLSSQQQTPQQPVVQRFDPKNIPAGIIGQRNLKAGYTMVKVGNSSERPISTNEIVLWFSRDTYVMSFWTGTEWKDSSPFT